MFILGLILGLALGVVFTLVVIAALFKAPPFF